MSYSIWLVCKPGMTIRFDMDDTRQIAAINFKHGFQEINEFLYQ